MRKRIFGMMAAVWIVLGATSVSAQSADYKNFTYEPSCTAFEEGSKPEKITVKDGEFAKREKKAGDEIDEYLSFVVTDVAYGDVNGDGADDAIVLTVCNTGGTGNFSEGFVYSSKNGKPTLLTRIEGGDRAYGGLRAARVENGLLVVESNSEGEMGGACCPEFVVTTKYNLKNGKLAAVGKPDKRELYPPTRVTFGKGASSSRMTAKLPAGELKRFVIGARAGQTLTVTSDMKDVSFMFYKGDVEEIESANGMKAKLLKNGDYVFSVTNNDTETEREILFKVEIK